VKPLKVEDLPLGFHLARKCALKCGKLVIVEDAVVESENGKRQLKARVIKIVDPKGKVINGNGRIGSFGSGTIIKMSRLDKRRLRQLKKLGKVVNI